MEFQIDVVEKVARVIGTPIIVCGNSDYTVRFTFDSEWLDKVSKTARFVWVKNGETHFEEVVFTGSTAKVPLLSGITCVQIGVYAGDLQTTTPARVPCMQSILCSGGAEHEDPPQDVYTQLIAMLEGLTVDSPITLALEEQNAGKAVSIWVGTRAQYDAIPESSIVANRFYFVTDDTGAEDIDQMRDDIDAILSGDKMVGAAALADRATSAGFADAATIAETANSAVSLSEGADKKLLQATADYATELKTGRVAVPKAETTDFTNAEWTEIVLDANYDHGVLQPGKTYQAYIKHGTQSSELHACHLTPFTFIGDVYGQELPRTWLGYSHDNKQSVVPVIINANFGIRFSLYDDESRAKTFTTDCNGNPIKLYIRELR